MKRRIWTAAVAAATLVAAPAFAQTEATDVDPGRMTERVESPTENLDVSAQAGLGSFVGGGALGETTGIGPTWGVRVSGPLARAFGWELGYEGSRMPVDNDFSVDDAGIWRHGVSGLAKIYTPNSDQSAVRPFAGAGIGGSYVTPSAGNEGAYQSDFVAEVPVGLGVEFQPEGTNLTAGVRGTYRFLVGQDIAGPLGDTGGGAILGGSLMVGGNF